MKPTIWKNCYSQQWAGILIPPAFAHPAKISLALVKKIFAHALELGWIRKGDTCVDPFAGVGGVAFGAMAAGLNFVGQELEPHFVELANGMDCTDEKLCPTCTARNQQSTPEILTLFDEPKRPHRFEGNLEFWKRKFGLSGAVIVQGDSRKLLENLRGRVECVVSSPPYANSLSAKTDGIDWTKCSDGKGGTRNMLIEPGQAIRSKHGKEYGESDGQLGAMRDKDFDLVVSSPPYVKSVHGGNGIDASKLTGNPAGPNSQAFAGGYGESSAQLAAMPEGCFDIAVSSPPFGDSTQVNNNPLDMTAGKAIWADGKDSAKRVKQDYQAMASLGAGETFWSAAREIVQQCFLALKPGGHAIWVLKDFLRYVKRIYFCEQWRLLCENVGFKTICIHQAMLTTEIYGQHTIHGDIEKKTRKRSSFFRNLAETNAKAKIYWENVSNDEKKKWVERVRTKLSKRDENYILQRARLEAYKAAGSPDIELDSIIDWEIVLCMVKV